VIFWTRPLNEITVVTLIARPVIHRVCQSNWVATYMSIHQRHCGHVSTFVI